MAGPGVGYNIGVHLTLLCIVTLSTLTFLSSAHEATPTPTTAAKKEREVTPVKEIKKTTHPYTEELEQYLAVKPTMKDFHHHWLEQHPRMTATQMAMALAVIEMGGYSSYSPMSPGLCDQVTTHASGMKGYGMGHIGWSSRKASAQAVLTKENRGSLNAEEIEGETFGRKGSLLADAKECIRMFKDEQSGGQKATRNGRTYWHWAHAYATSRAFCYDMNCTDKCTCVGILAYSPGQTPDADAGVPFYPNPPKGPLKF